jgi:hypothetical protein
MHRCTGQYDIQVLVIRDKKHITHRPCIRVNSRLKPAKIHAERHNHSKCYLPLDQIRFQLSCTKKEGVQRLVFVVVETLTRASHNKGKRHQYRSMYQQSRYFHSEKNGGPTGPFVATRTSGSVLSLRSNPETRASIP